MIDKKENTEEKIIDAARSVFIKKGMDGARMQEIADEAGINKALLHYYFRSKEKLFDKVFEGAFNSIAAGLRVTIDSDLSVMDKLKKFIDIYLTALESNPYLPLFVLNEININPDRMKNLLEEEIADNLQTLLADIMKEINSGNMRPINPIHLFVNILGMMIFPYAAKPLLNTMVKDKLGIDYSELMSERKQVIFDFVYNALKLDKDVQA